MPESPSNTKPDGADRKVGIGEIAVLQGAGVLRTLVGSCVGLVLHDRRAGVGGMAHIVLPSANGSREALGKYADTALPELLRRIEQAGGKPRNLVAKLAGGANMFATAKTNAIGELNLAMVERLLKDAAIPVLGRHCGGQQGRRIAYDVKTGSVTVEVVGSEPVEL